MASSTTTKEFALDAVVENHGSIFLFRPLTAAAEEWIEEHVDTETAQFFGNALAVEHRYIRDLVEGAIADGLRVN